MRLGRDLRACCVVLSALGFATDALSAPFDVDAFVDAGWRLLPKAGGVAGLSELDTEAQALAQTAFAFHPAAITAGRPLQKNMLTRVVSPAEITHTYPGGETHGTTGSATHRLTIQEVQADIPGRDPIAVPLLRDTVSSTLTPGQNELQKVGILARLQDPIVFSDSSPDANFAFESSGLDVSFSLFDGTAFPSQFATSPGQFGAVAEDTFARLRFRVAPGVVADPELFWSDGLAGAIDLFTVMIQSDAFFNVTATLILGSSTSEFVLDSSGIASAEAAIESAFVGGVLQGDLADLFSVGFVPHASLDHYTVGLASDLSLMAWETVPEPNTGALVLAGCVLLGARQCRSRGGSSRPRA